MYTRPQDENLSFARKADVSLVLDINPFARKYDHLFQHNSSRKTINVLTHLLNSHLNPNWRLPLDKWRKHATLCQNDSKQTCLSLPQDPGYKETKSGISSSEEANDGIVQCRLCGLEKNSEMKSSDYISPHLVTCMNNLVSHFELRYRSRLGSLLDDVALIENQCQESIDDELSLNDQIETFPLPPHLANDFPFYPTESSSLFNICQTDQPCEDGIDDDENGPGQRTDAKILFSKLWILLNQSRRHFFSVLDELLSERINWGRIVALLAFLRALCEVVERKQPNGLIDQVEDHNLMKEFDQSKHVSLLDEQIGSNDHPLTNEPGSNHLSDRAIIEPLLKLRPCASDYVMWTTEFIHGSKQVDVWIQNNGNWEGLIEFENHRYLNRENDDLSIMDCLQSFWPNSMNIDQCSNMKVALIGFTAMVVGAAGLMTAYRFLTGGRS